METLFIAFLLSLVALIILLAVIANTDYSTFLYNINKATEELGERTDDADVQVDSVFLELERIDMNEE